MGDYSENRYIFSQHAFLKKYLGVYRGIAQSWTTIKENRYILANMRFEEISRRVYRYSTVMDDHPENTYIFSQHALLNANI